jgi:cytoskeleton protein RodZ
MNILPSPAGPAVLPAPAPVAQALPVVSTGADTLVIVLAAESWVSVRDARQLLVSELKRGGQTLTLKGDAPFSVNVGNAPAVTLSLNGKAVDLKPYTQGAVASFTLKR